LAALQNLGGSMSNAQAQANAQGRRADWGDLAAGVAGAAGSGVVSAIKPEYALQLQREAQIAKAQQVYGQDAANAQTKASADWMTARPGIAYGAQQTKRDIAEGTQAVQRERIGVTDKFNNGKLKSWADRNAERADYDQWRMKDGSQRTDSLDAFREWQMDHGDDKLASEDQYHDWLRETTKARIAEATRHNKVTEGIGQQNADNGTTRVNRPPAVRGGANPQGAASVAINQLQSTRAAMARAEANGDHKMAAALRDKMKGLGDNIRTRFGDVVSDDENGWPTRLKPSDAPAQPAPQQQPQGAGTYAGRRISRANVPAVAQRMGMSTQQAESFLTSQGATIY
jgi:hypothetical protein